MRIDCFNLMIMLASIYMKLQVVRWCMADRKSVPAKTESRMYLFSTDLYRTIDCLGRKNDMIGIEPMEALRFALGPHSSAARE